MGHVRKPPLLSRLLCIPDNSASRLLFCRNFFREKSHRELHIIPRTFTRHESNPLDGNFILKSTFFPFLFPLFFSFFCSFIFPSFSHVTSIRVTPADRRNRAFASRALSLSVFELWENRRIARRTFSDFNSSSCFLRAGVLIQADVRESESLGFFVSRIPKDDKNSEGSVRGIRYRSERPVPPRANALNRASSNEKL